MKNNLSILLAILGLFLASCSDPCKDVFCQNGGNCEDGTCLCPEGFSGVNCEIQDDICETCTMAGQPDITICQGDFPNDVLNVIYSATIAQNEIVGYVCN